MHKTMFYTLLLWSLAAFGQTRLPQWKVVKVGRESGSATIQQHVLFTPPTRGLYRISAYMSATSTVKQNTGWNALFEWTDQTGLSTAIGLSVTLTDGTQFQSYPPFVFTVKGGTQVVGSVSATDPPPQNAPYDLVYTIEKLK